MVTSPTTGFAHTNSIWTPEYCLVATITQLVGLYCVETIILVSPTLFPSPSMTIKRSTLS